MQIRSKSSSLSSSWLSCNLSYHRSIVFCVGGGSVSILCAKATGIPNESHKFNYVSKWIDVRRQKTISNIYNLHILNAKAMDWDAWQICLVYDAQHQMGYEKNISKSISNSFSWPKHAIRHDSMKWYARCALKRVSSHSFVRSVCWCLFFSLWFLFCYKATRRLLNYLALVSVGYVCFERRFHLKCQ